MSLMGVYYFATLLFHESSPMLSSGEFRPEFQAGNEQR